MNEIQQEIFFKDKIQILIMCPCLFYIIYMLVYS